MTNWILVLTRNNLKYTRGAVESFLAQDIGNIRVLLIDDRSTDGTLQWAWTLHPQVLSFPRTMASGVAAMWNMGLGLLFGEAEYVLVCNNDVELRPDTYRHLVTDGGGFVTAVGVTEREQMGVFPEPPVGGPSVREHFHGNALEYREVLSDPDRDSIWLSQPDPKAKRPHPDFSCYLIRKEVYEKVGPFDENFKTAFCEDWDYHVRLHKAGIDAHCIDLPFLHYASQTTKNAPLMEREKIQHQAQLNREYFREKWGVEGGTDEYYALFNSEPPADLQ